ncbi:MAG TPA: hypothetical protein VGF24_19740 [Vicinamibacterales bacterium]
MRRLTVAVLALGCLALLAATVSVTRPVAVYAQVFGSEQCPVDPNCPGGVDKVVVCHFDESGKLHELCVNESAFPAHFEGGDSGHNKDFCLGETDAKKCEDAEPPK